RGETRIRVGLRGRCLWSRRFFGRQRRGAGRRRPFARSNIDGAPLRVFSGGEGFQVGPATLVGLAVQLFEEGGTPAAAGAGAGALGELAGHPRPVQAQEVDQLAARNVEAVTHLLVEVRFATGRHHTIISWLRPAPVCVSGCRPWPTSRATS